MPVVKVWGIPEIHGVRSVLPELTPDIRKAVRGIEELGITDDKFVTCLFPLDHFTARHDIEIIVEVTGLFVKTMRTAPVRARLAKAVGESILDWWTRHEGEDGRRNMITSPLIECLIYPFDQQLGYWSSAE